MSVAVSDVDYSLHRNLEISNIFPMGQTENSVTSNLSNYKLYSDPPRPPPHYLNLDPMTAF